MRDKFISQFECMQEVKRFAAEVLTPRLIFAAASLSPLPAKETARTFKIGSRQSIGLERGKAGTRRGGGGSDALMLCRDGRLSTLRHVRS